MEMEQDMADWGLVESSGRLVRWHGRVKLASWSIVGPNVEAGHGRLKLAG